MSPSQELAIQLQVAKLIYAWEYSKINGDTLTFRAYNIPGMHTFTDRDAYNFYSMEKCAQLITSPRKGVAIIAKWAMEGSLKLWV